MSKWRSHSIPELPGGSSLAWRNSSLQFVRNPSTEIIAEDNSDFESLMYAGECSRRHGDVIESICHYNRAIATQAKSYGESFIRALWAKSNLYRQVGNHSKCLSLLGLARHISRSSNNFRLNAAIHAGIAEVHRVEGNYSLAWKEHSKLYNYFLSIGDSRGAIWAEQGMAQILLMTNQPLRSMILFSNSLNLAFEKDDLKAIAFSYRGMGESAILMCDPDVAFQCLGVAEMKFKEISYRIGLGYTNLSLAKLNIYIGDYISAARELSKAEILFREASHGRGLCWLRRAKNRFVLKAGHFQWRSDIIR